MAEGESEVTFRDYLRVIHERKRIIFIAFIVVVASTAYFTFTSPKVYEATATLMIESRESNGSILEFSYYPVGRNVIQNYREILKSRTVAEQTANRLRDRSISPSTPKHVYSVDELMKQISVEPIRDTDILKVAARAPTPEDAAIIANTVTDVFIEQQSAVVRGEFTEQRRFVEEQLPIIKEKLHKSEEELRAFKEKYKFVALSEETKEITQKLAEFDKLYSQAQTNLNTTLSRLSYLEGEAQQQKALPEDIAKVSSPYILDLRKKLVSLESNYSMYLVQGLPEDNPKMVALKRSISDTKTKLTEETQKIASRQIPSLDPLSYTQELVDKILALKAEVAALIAKRDALKLVRQEYASKLDSLPATELKLARLKRERELNANTYQMLMKKYEEVKIAEAGKISNVRIVDKARIPKAPVRPRTKLNLILAIIVGLGLGLGVAFLLEYTDTSVKTPRDIERYSNLPLLGSIPMIKTKTHKKDKTSKIVTHLLIHRPTKSPISEAYRTIRTNLQFISPDKPLKTVLITSAIPEEGKSTVAANLAIAMAQMDLNTLVVDSDLRKPVIHKMFGISKNEGLTDFLIGKIKLESAINETKLENLSLLPSGAIPPNPSELIGSQKMESLIAKLRQYYDFVLFDSPPAVAVTDAAILGSKLDGVVLVVQASRTDRTALLRAKEIFENVRANLLGVILHMVVPPYGRNGYYYHYYHYYRYYSKEKE